MNNQNNNKILKDPEPQWITPKRFLGIKIAPIKTMKLPPMLDERDKQIFDLDFGFGLTDDKPKSKKHKYNGSPDRPKNPIKKKNNKNKKKKSRTVEPDLMDSDDDNGSNIECCKQALEKQKNQEEWERLMKDAKKTRKKDKHEKIFSKIRIS